MTPEPTVFVVDDDEEVRNSLRWLLESVQLHAETFGTAHEFLIAYRPERPGCLLLDVRMPGMSGLELQERLTDQKVPLPIIIITGHADVPMAVRAMKAEAIDFIEKPFSDQVLLERVQYALKLDAHQRQEKGERSGMVTKLALLTDREREVLELLIDGKSNRAMAQILAVSSKTVEAHRYKLMKKLEAQSLAHLVRIVLLSGVYQPMRPAGDSGNDGEVVPAANGGAVVPVGTAQEQLPP